MLRSILTLSIVALVGVPAQAASIRVKCTAWGGSHTGHYTFDINDETCRVYWHEIDTELRTDLCRPPRIVAVKPFAPAAGYVLKFNLNSGAFSDHVPGWADRGLCVNVPAEAED